MFARQQDELTERRRLLVMEADLHRGLVALERERLRERLAGLQAARNHVAAGGPMLAAAGAVAGLLAVRHWRKLARWIPTAIAALRWMRTRNRR
jgi:hypothetical protein